MLCAAPTVLIGLANAPDEMRRGVPRGVRVLTAGAPPAAVTIQRLEEGLGWTVTQVYGLTETAPFITVCEPRPEHAALPPTERATIKARQGVELITSGELRVVDEAGRRCRATARRMGEIVARGNVVMAGYYNDPEATAKAMRDGWFHSGDAAVVHPDGYVEIRDRLKDVIISGGENISSVEVEGDAAAASRRAGSRRWSACRTRSGAKRRTRSSWSRAARRSRDDELRDVCREQHRALQSAAQFHLHCGTAEDRDRQDSEIRAARRQAGHRPAIAARPLTCDTDDIEGQQRRAVDKPAQERDAFRNDARQVRQGCADITVLDDFVDRQRRALT